MLNTIFTGSEITAASFFICTAVSLLLGVLTAALSMFDNKPTQSLVITLAVTPVTVQLIIMLVNGNIGTGLAVAGAFGLVRYRSASASGKEISLIFLSMAAGLATGMGYVVLAAVFFLIVSVFLFVLQKVRFGAGDENVRSLKITISENLDYDGLFDDVFAQYTDSAELEKVKTSNMGTLYELDYAVRLKDGHRLKAFMDELRCRNGNLNIVCGKPVAPKESI
ncbi:MAG: DUF4956 domain-containing protein [Anaerolineaceae bacterium]|nr:DUF4956 domain-containing protein [Anaerolineaceae bacterium]